MLRSFAAARLSTAEHALERPAASRFAAFACWKKPTVWNVRLPRTRLRPLCYELRKICVSTFRLASSLGKQNQYSGILAPRHGTVAHNHKANKDLYMHDIGCNLKKKKSKQLALYILRHQYSSETLLSSHYPFNVWRHWMTNFLLRDSEFSSVIFCSQPEWVVVIFMSGQKKLVISSTLVMLELNSPRLSGHQTWLPSIKVKLEKKMGWGGEEVEWGDTGVGAFTATTSAT